MTSLILNLMDLISEATAAHQPDRALVTHFQPRPMKTGAVKAKLVHTAVTAHCILRNRNGQTVPCQLCFKCTQESCTVLTHHPAAAAASSTQHSNRALRVVMKHSTLCTMVHCHHSNMIALL